MQPVWRALGAPLDQTQSYLRISISRSKDKAF
jgi:hypothetical protein